MTSQLEDLGCSRIFSGTPLLQPAFVRPTGERVCVGCQALCHNGDTFVLPKVLASTPPVAFVCQCKGMGGGCLFEQRFCERMGDAERRDALNAYMAPMRAAVTLWTDKARPVMMLLLNSVEYLVRSLAAPRATELAREWAGMLMGRSAADAVPLSPACFLRFLREPSAQRPTNGAWLLPVCGSEIASRAPTCNSCHRPVGCRRDAPAAVFTTTAAGQLVCTDTLECAYCWTSKSQVVRVGVADLLQDAITRYQQGSNSAAANTALPSRSSGLVSSLSFSMCLAALLDACDIDARLGFAIRIADGHPMRSCFVECWDPVQRAWLCIDTANGVPTARARAASTTSKALFDHADMVVILTLDGELSDATSTYFPNGGTSIDKDALAKAVYAPSAASAAKRLRDEAATMPSRRAEAAKRRAEQRVSEIAAQETQSLRTLYIDLNLCAYDDPAFALPSEPTDSATPMRLINAMLEANQRLLDHTADNDSDVPLRPFTGEVAAVDGLLRQHARIRDDPTSVARAFHLLSRCLSVWPEKQWPALAGAVRLLIHHQSEDTLAHLRLDDWAGILRDRIFATDMLADIEPSSSAASARAAKPLPRWSPENTAAVIALTHVAIELWRNAGTAADAAVSFSRVVLDCVTTIIRPENASVVAYPPAAVSHAFCGVVEAAAEGLLASASMAALTPALYAEVAELFSAVAVVIRASWFVSFDSKLQGAFEFVAEFEDLLPATRATYLKLATRLKDAPGQQLRAAILSRFNAEDE